MYTQLPAILTALAASTAGPAIAALAAANGDRPFDLNGDPSQPERLLADGEFTLSADGLSLVVAGTALPIAGMSGVYDDARLMLISRTGETYVALYSKGDYEGSAALAGLPAGLLALAA